MKLISQGAEAKIFLENDTIIKHRIKKEYRHTKLDTKLRKSRTNREIKIIQKLEKNKVRVPKIISYDKDNYKIFLEYIGVNKLKDVMEINTEEKSFDLGKLIGKMHESEVIHGDLTTSNFLVDKENQLIIIDFGLSFVSNKTEDFATDLRVLEQVLNASHKTISNTVWINFKRGYREVFKKADKVIEQLKIVRSRGRHKKKVK